MARPRRTGRRNWRRWGYKSLIFWDLDNDGHNEYGEGSFDITTTGGDWTSGKKAKLASAADIWAYGTDYDPTYATSSDWVFAYTDGTAPSGQTWAALDDPLAATSALFQWKNNHAYGDIFGGLMYVNKNGYTWNYAGPCGGWCGYYYKGVLVHELGHLARLDDLVPGVNCGSPIRTMCGEASQTDTESIESLTSDDVESANIVYPF